MANIILRKIKHQLTFANIIVLLGCITALIYVFSYLFPFTDNAFVVNNIRPVAAQVRGYVTNIYVKNGDYVKKGEKLFTVFDKPYQYAYEQLSADLDAAKAKLDVTQKTLERDQQQTLNHHATYVKLEQDDEKFQKAYKINAVSKMTLQNSEQETKAAQATYLASQKQVEIDKKSITMVEKEIAALTAKVKNAKVDLDETIVYAETDGIIQNFFISLGTPVNVNQPLFSFVDTDEIYLQANFNETDLSDVKQDNEVLIFPRIYLGRKMFHGKITSDYWAANRQYTDNRSQIQNVTNENQWILLPQRMPVQIKITDPDPKYPLRAGTSAYVYIKTK